MADIQQQLLLGLDQPLKKEGLDILTECRRDAAPVKPDGALKNLVDTLVDSV